MGSLKIEPVWTEIFNCPLRLAAGRDIMALLMEETALTDRNSTSLTNGGFTMKWGGHHGYH
jgi:hypothetical protein